MKNGITFDTGALIALERRGQRARMVLERATEQKIRITVPAAVITEWWRSRNDVRERILAGVRVEPLSESLAKVAGEALAAIKGATPIDAIVGELEFASKSEQPARDGVAGGLLSGSGDRSGCAVWFGLFLSARPTRFGSSVGLTRAIALALDSDHVGVMDHAVDERGGASGIGEDAGPVAEGEIGGEDGAFFLVASAARPKQARTAADGRLRIENLTLTDG